MSPSTTNASATQPKELSQAAWLKNGGWNNMYEFMLSHGLNMYDDNELQEGKAIIHALRQADQEAWEEARREEARKAVQKERKE